jgi:hypothetical protein
MSRTSEGNLVDIHVADAVELLKWTHLCASVEANGTMHLFKNGVQLNCTSGTVCDTSTGKGMHGQVPDRLLRTNSYIGRSNHYYDAYFKGSLSDFTLMDGFAVTTEAEAVKIMLTTHTIPTTDVPLATNISLLTDGLPQQTSRGRYFSSSSCHTARNNTRLVCPPNYDHSILVIDSADPDAPPVVSTATIPTTIDYDVPSNGAASAMCFDVMGSNNSNLIVCPPYQSNTRAGVLVINPEPDEPVVSAFGVGADFGATSYSSACVAVGPKLICAPNRSPAIMVADTTTETVSFIGELEITSAAISVDRGMWKAYRLYGGCAAVEWGVGTKVICAPFDANAVLLVEVTETNDAESSLDGVELEASTANMYRADTSEKIFVEFYVNKEWSEKALFFEGSVRGETHKKIFASAVGATKLRLSIGGDDGWGFWQIKFGGVTIREHTNGKIGVTYFSTTCSSSSDSYTGVGFWIDGDQCAPSSIDFDISKLFPSAQCQFGVSLFPRFLCISHTLQS